ncbi:SCO6880 family protein [Nocardia sp. CDC160]|uniref:SCO6880 family protein n=1 Tax=Nocardia sp. CDC160 TaxID=3112166 RepID=UPI002DBFEF53|nr:SCO6880 family protein [Nocardia sp. CDC160]MEC3919318.1 SCO6880 family protein [Nocardia sp. CDC160]
MATHVETDIERTYSAGTVPRAEGLLGLSWPAMVTAGTVVITAMITHLIAGFPASGIVLATGAAIAGPLVIRIRGRSGYERAILLARWVHARRRRETLYHGGAFSTLPGRSRKLPGLLVSTRLYSGRDIAGWPFGMIHAPKLHEYTIVLACWPQGAEAVDQPIVDRWVAAWGGFLADIGGQPDVAAIVPVLDTVPETGNRLLKEVQTLTDPDAPASAREVLWALGTGLPAQHVRLEARLAITLRATTPERRKDPAEQALEIARRLPGITAALDEAGVRSRPMTAEEIIAFVRRSFDPSSQPDLEAAAAEPDGHGLTWDQTGPSEHDERRDHYRHMGAVSVSWEMDAQPQGVVTERVLTRLLEPNPDLPRKRVAVVYRPHSAAEATTIVDNDYKDALVGSQNQRGGITSAASVLRVQATEQARAEQARGHGVSSYGILVTVTNPAGTDLPRIEALTKDLSTQCRLHIERCYRYQAAAFAASLGVGVILPEHASVPKFLEG